MLCAHLGQEPCVHACTHMYGQIGEMQEAQLPFSWNVLIGADSVAEQKQS